MNKYKRIKILLLPVLVLSLSCGTQSLSRAELNKGRNCVKFDNFPKFPSSNYFLKSGVTKPPYTGTIEITINTALTSIEKGKIIKFDPKNLKNIEGLGLLEGDFNQETELLDSGLSQVIINKEDLLIFRREAISADFVDSCALEDFKKLYGVTEDDKISNYYILYVNLDKSPIQNLESLIREYNRYFFVEIKKLDFSSLAALKTFAILFDFAVRYYDSYKTLDVELALENGEVHIGGGNLK